MPAAGKYIDADELATRLTPATYLAIYDDSGTGDVASVNDQAVQQDIDGAEGEVDSYLITDRALPLPAIVNPSVDRLVRLAALDFATALAFLRHPEYVRTFGENPKAQGLWERATARMKRLKTGMVELPDVDKQAAKPLNVGGVVLDEGPRTIITSSDGRDNGSGF